MRATAIAAAVTLCAGAAVRLRQGAGFQDYARVREVHPEYQSVNVPRQECYSEVVPQSATAARRLDRRSAHRWRRGRIAGVALRRGQRTCGVRGRRGGRRRHRRRPGRRTATMRSNTPSAKCAAAARWTTGKAASAATACRTSTRAASYSTMLPYDPGPQSARARERRAGRSLAMSPSGPAPALRVDVRIGDDRHHEGSHVEAGARGADPARELCGIRAYRLTRSAASSR